jgi:uncharacterized protein (DUF2267 family)
MRPTGIRAFDSTIHTTNVWLNDLMDQLGWEDKQRAYQALRVVLHALRDHLTVEQAAALGAQLPMMVRGFYYEGWHPAGKPLKDRKLGDFLLLVGAELPDGGLGLDVEEVVRAVFHVIAKHVTPGEVDHVRFCLPGEFRSLWAEELHTVWF